MLDSNFGLAFGWCGVLAGFAAGALLGLRHADDAWLGGHSAYPRRMLRLAHVALVALGALNVLLALSAPALGLAPWAARAASALLVTGAVLMPACCVLAAWRRPLGRLFPAPVAALLGAACVIALGGLT